MSKSKYRPNTVYRQEFDPGDAHSFDAKAFDEALASQSVPFIHYRAMGCPHGMVNKDDTTRRLHQDHPGCSNGYLYKKVGCVLGFFHGNSESAQFQDMGTIDGSTATATMQRFYQEDGDHRVYLSYADRLYLADESILWPHWERYEHNLSGWDRLRFPAVQVEHLIDSNMKEYRPGEDFDVIEGQIRWRPGRSPGANLDAGPEGRGVVCTVWYLYQPYWYVQRISHAIRVVQTENEAGERVTTRMPFEVTLVRETAFEDAEVRDDGAEDEEPREAKRAPDGSLGPR